MWSCRRLMLVLSCSPWILAAACRVLPEVSSDRSSGTTSVQPSFVRWYKIEQPMTPLPMTTAWAWDRVKRPFGMQEEVSLSCPGPTIGARATEVWRGQASIQMSVTCKSKVGCISAPLIEVL